MENTSTNCICAASIPDDDNSRSLLTLAQLCPQCQNVIDRLDWPDGCSRSEFADDDEDSSHTEYEGRHQASLSDLKASAEAGCGLCRQFVIASQSNNTGLYKPPDTGTGWVKAEHHDSGRVSLTLYYPSPYSFPENESNQGDVEDRSPRMSVHSVLYVEMVRSAQLAEFDGCPEHRDSTMGALPLCRRWFQQCCHAHEDCVPDRKLQSTTPTRLVHIGPQGPRIQLADEVKEGNGVVKYATLSHCWGRTPFPTLTSVNYETFRHRIPPSALTKTFLDAIHITQALGICYLWIDSLCIIQDSLEDWERESAMMEDVYGASSLTIAATSASDGSEGCFFNRSLDWRCQIRQRQSMKLWDVYPAPMFPRRYALSRRAWALQERWLSRRTLHFTRHQVFWECDRQPACETYPQGYPPDFPFYEGFARKKRPLTVEQWPDIVDDYSLRELTRISDTFAAISGIARLIQDQTQDEYIAGMWMEGLGGQLTWENKGRSRFYDEYIAPSWSWASAKDGVKCKDHVDAVSEHSELYITVLAVHIRYASANPLGEITGATLRLWCEILCPVVVHESRTYGGPIWSYYSAHFLLSFGRSTSSEGNAEVKLGTEGESEGKRADWHFDILREALILPVKRGSSGEGWGCTGLLLEPTGIINGQYRRVGTFTYRDREEFSQLVDKENLVGRDPTDHFLSTEDGISRYIIELV